MKSGWSHALISIIYFTERKQFFQVGHQSKVHAKDGGPTIIKGDPKIYKYGAGGGGGLITWGPMIPGPQPIAYSGVTYFFTRGVASQTISEMVLLKVEPHALVDGSGPANLSASNAWKMAKKMAEMLGKRVKCMETAVAKLALQPARVHIIEFLIH